MKLLGIHFFISLVLLDLSKANPQRNVTNATFFYNGTHSYLEVSAPIVLTLHGPNGETITSVNLTDAGDPSVKIIGSSGIAPNSSSTVENLLTIKFGSSIKGTNGSTFSGIKLAFVLSWDLKSKTLPDYWSLSNLAVDYIANVASGKKYSGTGVEIDVAPRSGYTSSPVDVSCERGYTVCAPVDLCWTCDNQELLMSKNVNLSSMSSSVSPGILFPGLKLQPFFRNSSRLRSFGYNWDCDPLLSIAVWVSVLIPLLLFFILSWAVSMLANVYTPDKFDDPKGKGFTVYTSE